MRAPSLASFYAKSGLYAVLSLSGALFNYALYLVLAHILNVKNFGNFVVIVALSNQILAFLLAFNVISVSLVKNYNGATAHDIAQAILKVLIRFFIGLSILVLALSPVLITLLKINQPSTFFVLPLLLLINVPIVIWTGYLQGHKRLINVGIYNFSSALTKLVLAIVFGIVFGVLGALWGVVGGTLFGMALLWFTSDIKLPNINSSLQKLTDVERRHIKEIGLFTVEAIVVVGGLGFLQNIDITYAKVFFSPHIAGVYSGVSILSNAVYYVALLLVWVVLSEIELKNPIANRRILRTAYRLLALLAVGALLIEVLLRQILAQKLLGNHFVNQGQVLIFATMFQISLVAVTLYAFYLLVIRSRRSFWLSLLVILSCLILPLIFNGSPRQMIASLWAGVLIGTGMYFIINVFMRNSFNGQDKQIG